MVHQDTIKVAGLVLFVMMLLLPIGFLMMVQLAATPSTPSHNLHLQVAQNNYGDEGVELVLWEATATQYVTEVDRTFTTTHGITGPIWGEDGIRKYSMGKFYDSGDVVNVQITFEGYTDMVEFTYDFSQEVYEVTWQEFTIRFGYWELV
jgi:hypothetical protein